jgi:hypothetical protein
MNPELVRKLLADCRETGELVAVHWMKRIQTVLRWAMCLPWAIRSSN